jgi:hypothetical protein
MHARFGTLSARSGATAAFFQAAGQPLLQREQDRRMPEQAAVQPAPRLRSGGDAFVTRHTKLLSIAWFSALYLPATLLIAAARPLWNDEIFTYYIARRPTLAGIWEILTTGVDQIPPVFYWLTRACMSLPGNPRVLMRLPAIAGFWLLGVCLAAFVWRRLPAVYGLAAALVALATGAYSYAYEGRPYAIVAGLGAFALLSWQRVDGPNLFLWTFALAASLAASVSMHYYSVLLFVPLAGAEALRSWTGGRFRPYVWVALATGAVPLVFWLPLIRAARTFSGSFWAKPTATSVAEFALFLFGGALLPFGALIVAGLVLHFSKRAAGAAGIRSRVQRITLPPGEIAAMILFLSIPISAFILAVALTGAFTSRYSLAAVIGAGLLGAWLMASAFGAHLRPAILAVFLLSSFFGARVIYEFRHAVGKDAEHAGMLHFLKAATPESLVLIPDPHLFFELSHEAPRSLQRRLVYFAEPRLALQYVGTDTMDRCLELMSRVAPLRLIKLSEFLRSGSDILVYGYPAVYGEWAVQEMVARHLRISVVGAYDGRLLLHAASGLGSSAPSVPGNSAEVAAGRPQ